LPLLGHILHVTLALSTWLASGELVEAPVDEVARSLAARAKSGDRAALRSIYERYAPQIRRFVRDMLRDPPAADDALQDTFVRVFQHITALDEPEHLAGWIFGIARRVCLEHRRHTSRRQRNTEQAQDSTDMPDSSATPEAVFFGSEAAAALDRAVDQLEPNRRAVLLLRCDHQLSYEEIATAMGFSLAKVKVELHRARLSLREVIHGGAPR
jgi:RNA polymerase sigma-70 factor, ECF subfamily